MLHVGSIVVYESSIGPVPFLVTEVHSPKTVSGVVTLVVSTTEKKNHTGYEVNPQFVPSAPRADYDGSVPKKKQGHWYFVPGSHEEAAGLGRDKMRKTGRAITMAEAERRARG